MEREIISIDEVFEPAKICRAYDDPEEEVDQDFEAEIGCDDILDRDDAIRALTTRYVCALMGIEESDAALIDFPSDDLESIIDDFERVLFEHGITIYRPCIIKDENGNWKIIRSIYGEELA